VAFDGKFESARAVSCSKRFSDGVAGGVTSGDPTLPRGAPRARAGDPKAGTSTRTGGGGGGTESGGGWSSIVSPQPLRSALRSRACARASASSADAARRDRSNERCTHPSMRWRASLRSASTARRHARMRA